MRDLILGLGALLLFITMEGFIRVVILFYHRSELIFFGIEQLPSNTWIPVILFGTLVNSWLSVMLFLTISGSPPEKAIRFVLPYLVGWKLFEVYLSYHSEPVWYLISSFGLVTMMCYAAFYVKKKM